MGGCSNDFTLVALVLGRVRPGYCFVICCVVGNDYFQRFFLLFSWCRTEMKMAALTHFRLLFLVFVCRKKPVNSEPAADAKQAKHETVNWPFV